MFKLEHRNPLHACQLAVYRAAFEQVLVDLGHGHKLPLGRPHIQVEEHQVHFQREELVPFHVVVLGGIAPFIVAPHLAEACESMETGDGLVGVLALQLPHDLHGGVHERPVRVYIIASSAAGLYLRGPSGGLLYSGWVCRIVVIYAEGPVVINQ